MSATRREFVEGGVLVGAGLAAPGLLAAEAGAADATGKPAGEQTARRLPLLDNVKPRPDEDVLLRMQRELVRAMAKPLEQRKWAMVIDTRKCVGCHACTIGCVAENKLPPDVVYRPVLTEESGKYPQVQLRFTPRPCMHCAKPKCVEVCPEKAISVRPDGIVVIDYEKCTNKATCVHDCPYKVPLVDLAGFYGEGTPRIQDYETRPNFEYGKQWKRTPNEVAPPMGKARKCHFCLHRLEVGQLPMCVTTCIGRATYFGDANDPKALVNEVRRGAKTMRLLEHLGTEPRVIYLI